MAPAGEEARLVPKGIIGAVIDNPIMGYQRDYEKESYQPIEARPLD
jgi:hypothetical protein